MSEWISVKDRLPDKDETVLILFKEICEHCGEKSSFRNRALGFIDEDNEWNLTEPFDKDYFPEKHKYCMHVTHWTTILESLDLLEDN